VTCDRCGIGALSNLLTAAPAVTPFGAKTGVLTSINDFASRPARGFADGEEFSIGRHRMKWLYTPHVPHGCLATREGRGRC
jgi:hypothetical protein